MRWNAKLIVVVLAGTFLAIGPGCSVRRYAINKLGDALAQSGSTFAADEDPELVKQAVPFSLKLVESLLAESPNHPGLLQAAASGFTQYAYAFVQQEADECAEQDLAKASAQRERARKLYLRASHYGVRGLAARHPHWDKLVLTNIPGAMKLLATNDLPTLYWTMVAWGAAISLSKDKPDIIADLPIVEALVDRAMALNEAYGHGSLHAFLISFEGARKDASGDLTGRIQKHFDRAMALSHGQLAAPLVGYAENVCVAKQNLKQFKALLEQALAVNPDARPEWRLENLVMQRRARWLLSRVEDLFLKNDDKSTP